MALQAVTDFSAFAAQKKDARDNDPAALMAAAKQFEALFTQMLLKSMRDASSGEDILGGGQQGDLYRDMFDRQLSMSLADSGNAGRGLGIAEMMVRQLTPKGSPQPTDGAGVVDPDNFVEKMLPHAQAAAERLGVAPRLVLAQSALETGWGKHSPDGSNNYFGIKSKAGQADVKAMTHEYGPGGPRRELAAFRAYRTAAESFGDYARLVGGNERYAGAVGAGEDSAKFARGLVQGGYATDPNYAAKLQTLADDPAFRARVAAATKKLSL